MSEDVRDGWVIECNESKDPNADNWKPAWETWFIEDRAEADRLEKLYSKRHEEPIMKPRPFLELLEMLKKERPLGSSIGNGGIEQWNDYRFVNVNTGMIINACILR